MKTNHNINVNCEADVAFSFCLNVENWPSVFPPCLAANVVSETPTEQVIDITAIANDSILSWTSKREIDRQARTISFKQTKPSPLLKYMQGTWQVNVQENGCSIELIHEFEVKEAVSGLVEGVETREQAHSYMLECIERNSNKELGAIKEAIEKQALSHEFEATMTLPYTKSAVFQLLRDAKHWPQLLPHCEEVQMHYQDHENQEFTMVVKVEDKEEKIRSIRKVEGGKISYFQPSPPPALLEHQGYWTVKEVETGVEITSWHNIVVNADFWTDTAVDQAKAKIETAINNNSIGTMKAIDSSLKGTEHATA
ncbi:aromatase/cyclase [Pseudoalteromonas luteoviolacea]|uniref:Coenzyme Q-binding protein COQ10 START domain-containing protein n=1 Tax=Pseudoalteromonas luteoviolacea S4060-1 TaxID=1365257 RepID=A0A167L6D8_9GAMM|nr:SRPBCC family protein [Pseudoalteromonas luteoviolacea]KZN63886.1 hypothetical protein N478_23345 [Pseudoalteromonas luteoviolacea S4060-1]